MKPQLTFLAMHLAAVNDSICFWKLAASNNKKQASSWQQKLSLSFIFFNIYRPIAFAFQSPEPVRVSVNSSGVTGVGSTNMVVYVVLPDGDLEPVVAANFVSAD